MSEAEDGGTAPVYIGDDMKKEVKLEATERELTMRQISERLIARGMEDGLHTVPLPREFLDDISDLSEDVERARDAGDLDRVEDRLNGVRDDLEDVDLFEDDAEDSVSEAIEQVQDEIDQAREQFEDE